LKASIWFVVITAFFITCLLTANLLAVKLIAVFGFFLPAGVIVFPLSYLFSDVLTEVYGYQAARFVIWLGFLCNFLAVVALFVGGIIPAAPVWHDQGAYNTIFGSTPRAVLASCISYIVGEFTNAFILAKLKIATRGRWLWVRTIGSTFIGEGLDSLIFICIVFWGTLPTAVLFTMVLTQWIFKVVYEIIATPLTYSIVLFLKRREGVDTYDYHTNFNPFSLQARLVGK
jgi:uncharacterized integral membrane protein (TIGR00697 family)